MNSKATLSIRTTLGIIVALLAGLLLIACSIAGLDAWRGYVVAVRVAEVNASTDHLLKGLESIQLERGQTNTALQAAAAAATDVKDLIQKRRTEGDPLLGQALAAIDPSTMTDGQQLLDDVRQAYARVKQLRQKADSDLQLPKEQRDAELLKSWY